MNKNNVILILFLAALLGSTWGSVVNRQKIDLEQQLRNTRAELKRVSGECGPEFRQAPGQAGRAEETARLAKAEKEVGELRVAKDFLETRLAQCNAAIRELAEKGKAGGGVGPEPPKTAATPPAAGMAGAGESSGSEAFTQLRNARLVVERLQQRLDEANAQLIGLEKIVDEKDVQLKDAAQEKDRLQINMDVLLAKIADLQGELRAIQGENHELVKQMAARNEDSADPGAGKPLADKPPSPTSSSPPEENTPRPPSPRSPFFPVP